MGPSVAGNKNPAGEGRISGRVFRMTASLLSAHPHRHAMGMMVMVKMERCSHEVIKLQATNEDVKRQIG